MKRGLVLGAARRPARAAGVLAVAGGVLAFACHAAPAAPADFEACLARLRSEALAKGIGAEAFATYAATLEPNDVLHFESDQPEFSTPVWDYLAGLVDQERVDDGKAMMAQYADVLGRIEARFGVDRAVLVAFWGVESDYGRAFGQRPVIQSLATLSCYGRKPAYYRSEFVAALRILEQGDVKPERFNGSWAGAFGHTQFMPSTFLRTAVDLEGNGHPNIVDSVPDALASTANYLRRAGWVPGLAWGIEVKLPPVYTGPAGRKSHHPMGFWEQHGIRRLDGAPLGSGEAGLLLPAGPKGPAFLVTRNFDAIYAYNAAESYSLAVGHLADRLAGGGPIATPWPTDDPGLARVDRREVQSLLQRKGYDIGNADGVIGTKTREAIADFEGKIGLPRNGRASLHVLEALRAGR